MVFSVLSQTLLLKELVFLVNGAFHTVINEHILHKDLKRLVKSWTHWLNDPVAQVLESEWTTFMMIFLFVLVFYGHCDPKDSLKRLLFCSTEKNNSLLIWNNMKENK